jgi:hypothetical protein
MKVTVEQRVVILAANSMPNHVASKKIFNPTK